MEDEKISTDAIEKTIGLVGLVGFVHLVVALPVAIWKGLWIGVFAATLGVGFVWASFKIYNALYDDDDEDEDDPDRKKPAPVPQKHLKIIAFGRGKTEDAA